jgi:uncharacterized damage-inducible protein DinB
MNADAFRHLYHYHFAENRKLWDAVLTISDQQFLEPNSYSHGSVRDQIIHLIDVDQVWFSELQGIEPPAALPDDAHDRAIIRAHWESAEQLVAAYLNRLSDQDLFSTPIREPAEDRDLIVWQVLIHVINHGTDHRAQILRLLNTYGIATTAQDYIFYAYEHPLR